MYPVLSTIKLPSPSVKPMSHSRSEGKGLAGELVLRKALKSRGLAVLRKVSEEPGNGASVSCGLASSTLDFSTDPCKSGSLTKVSNEAVPAYGKIFLMEGPTGSQPSIASGSQVCKPICADLPIAPRKSSVAVKVRGDTCPPQKGIVVSNM